MDPLGRGALLMAIDNENLQMVELLVVMGVETKDALLHAIDKEFVEAVELLLEHEELIHKEGEKYVRTFPCVSLTNKLTSSSVPPNNESSQ
jgi:transient-receptor-potential-like protein